MGQDGTDSNEEIKEEEYYKVSREEYEDDNGVAGSKMMLLEPRAYSESQQIADHLKNRNAVVVNLKRVTPDQGKKNSRLFIRYTLCYWWEIYKN